MAKSMGFEKLDVFPIRAMQKVSNEHLTKATRRIFEYGQDHRGKGFKRYTFKYAKLKATGFKKKDGSRYKAYAGVPLSSNRILPPDLTLTGRTRKNFRRRGRSKTMYKIGWAGESGAIIHGQKEQGRDVISGIPRNELNWVRDRLVKEMDREFKVKLKDIRIIVGK